MIITTSRILLKGSRIGADLILTISINIGIFDGILCKEGVCPGSLALMSSKRDRLQDRVEKRRILLDERQITAGSILGSCRAGSPCNAIKRWDHVTTVLAPVSVTVAENDNGSLSAMLWTHEFNMKIMKYYPIQTQCPNCCSYYDLQVSPRSDDTVASNPGFSFLVLFHFRKLDLQK
uniref:Uncharacterized protein n=1 Tax=Glossina palpalis gambiensis TaxID=67801 RepID=A0A1B0BYA6_9MUSC